MRRFRWLSAGLAISLISTTAFADGANFSPDSYFCWDYPSLDKRDLTIQRVEDHFELTFNGVHPGELKEFLLPLGVDRRIVSSYRDWKITTRVPVADCQRKTFASRYPEELNCNSSQVQLSIKASFRDDGQVATDTYNFPGAGIAFGTKVHRKTNSWGVEDNMHFNFAYAIKSTTGSTNIIKSELIFNVRDYHETDGGYGLFAECRLRALDDIVDIDVNTLIERRQ